MRTRWAKSRAAVNFARFAVLVVAGHLSQAADVDFGPDGPLILGIDGLDARPLFVLATIAGVVYAWEWKTEWIRWCWVVLLTVCAWGRALSLLLVGSPILNRVEEVSAFVSWTCVWLAGILAALFLTISPHALRSRR